MCHASASLRLCTCSVSDISALKNYWVLYRFQGFRVFGQSVLFAIFDNAEEIKSGEALLEAMNQPDVFDVEMDLKDFDRIELVFTYTAYEKEIHRFQYKHGKWQTMSSDEIGFMYNHKWFAQGELDYQ